MNHITFRYRDCLLLVVFLFSVNNAIINMSQVKHYSRFPAERLCHIFQETHKSPINSIKTITS